MDTCSNCGATLSPDLEWCGRCYAPVRRQAPSDAGARPVAPWVTSRPAPEPSHVQEYSRWRGSSTSFGPAGRVMLTVLVVIAAVLGYPLVRGLIFTVAGMDVPGTGFYVMYMIVAIPGALYLYLRIWRSSRIS